VLFGRCFSSCEILQEIPKNCRVLAAACGLFSRIQGHHINMDIFSSIVALGMTANVLLGPVAFFWPDFSRAVPTLMGYCT